MSNICALDTNVWLYIHDSSDERKRKIADNILADNPKIPAQVISEYINVCRRLLQVDKAELLSQCALLVSNCDIIPTTAKIISKAAQLVKKYDLQIFDAIILASSLDAGCTILFSEDMQNGFKVDGLTVVNPFVK